ncbi:short transient receptor potential channel 1-like [Tigriopus californicus]|uniref:short transient receptor potential channel 1-like n=1 Tax=Tigriopus californicus TaxID=6832 RepID=UPI0027DA896C|nr:short transient receptor potential channel 1-like [Tigriopus californicus]
MEGKQWSKVKVLVLSSLKAFSMAECNTLSPQMILALRRLQGDFSDVKDSVDGANIHSEHDLMGMFRENKNFYKMYLLLCVEKNIGQLKSYTNRATELKKSWLENKTFNADGFFENLFDSLISKAVEMNNSKALSEVLSAAQDSSSLSIKKPLNHQALINVCESENRKLAEVFLFKGYRLQSTHFKKEIDKDSKKEIKAGRKEESETESEQESEKNFCLFMPFFPPKPKKGNKKKDEIQNYRILRAMAQPCYILSQFVVIYERLKTVQQNPDEQDSPKKKGDTLRRNDSHCSPLDDMFRPIFPCSKHVECNDPVFRCFEMVKIANKCARNVPEYREEYEEIGARCSNLTVELLQNCKDTNEVETFLSDKIGALRFFRLEIANKIKYPRLQIAIQNNHRAFVGHMFCQQVLRTHWHGNVPWLGKGFWFKLVYCFIQVLFTVPFVISYLIREIIRGPRNGNESRNTEERSKRPYNCNLDEPLNRFISFTGMYLAFVALVILSVMCSVTDRDQLLNNFHWYHSCLFIFTIAMIVNDAYILTSVRSVVKAFNFWRTYDLVMHSFLLMAFIARILMGKIHPCIDGECSEDVMRKRVPFDMFSNCALSVAAVMSGMRLFYWCQLHDRIGPIVINLSKVIMDLATFTVIFLIMIMSFGIGIVSLKVKNLAIYPGRNSTTDNEPPQYDLYDFSVWDYIVAFLETCLSLFWSSLNPEEPTEFYMDRMDGIFLHIIYGAYCVACVIVLLNLLIAIMNATIQKVSDSEHLYWKFVRTSIWIEFVGEENGLPMPFTGLLATLNLAKHLIGRCKQRWRDDSDVSGKTQSPDDVNSIQERKEVREEQNKLLYDLIQRYWRNQNKKDSRWKENESKISMSMEEN